MIGLFYFAVLPSVPCELAGWDQFAFTQEHAFSKWTEDLHLFNAGFLSELVSYTKHQ